MPLIHAGHCVLLLRNRENLEFALITWGVGVKRFFIVLWFWVFALSALPAAYGQFTGTLSGTVLDPNGAAVPDASLRLTNSATGVTLTTRSDARGTYHFNSLAPADYRLEARGR